jgi:G3E family GTPase
VQFGEIDIDSELVSIREELDPAKEQILMLNNGCLCCTVRDDLVEMLTKLVRARAAGKGGGGCVCLVGAFFPFL